MKSVLTLAVGKQLYIDMAVTLARSFYVWNKEAGIDFYIATDNKQLIAADVLKWVKVIELQSGELGEGFSPKLHLDKIAPTSKTLFIDSDCLIVKPLASIFEKMSGRSVSVVGNFISEGEWFGDVKSVCDKIGVEKIPKFNGGLYYLEKGEITSKVYLKARELEPDYDNIGLIRLRNKPNDELLMALAMAYYHQVPIPEDGNILGELVNFQSGIGINVLKGNCILKNNPKHANYQSSWPLQVGYPMVVHFLGDHTNKYPYLREKRILKEIFENNRSVSSARIIAFFSISLPKQGIEILKNIFRPVYNLIFGYRKIEQSARV
jgi:hypothetical protein